MNSKSIIILTFAITLFLLTPVLSVSGPAHDYAALKGVSTANAVFDFRDGIPESALIHLSLIHQTYKDRSIQDIGGKPHFVVVFMDNSVKFLSSNRDSFTQEERKIIEKFDKVLSAMAEDGIRLEICMFAADFYNVDPESITPVVERVPNGWISSIGYQAQGYVLVPVF